MCTCMFKVKMFKVYIFHKKSLSSLLTNKPRAPTVLGKSASALFLVHIIFRITEVVCFLPRERRGNWQMEFISWEFIKGQDLKLLCGS